MLTVRLFLYSASLGISIMKELRGLRHDRRGGIEGLPLQLMIIILIATVGTGIILGWMGSIDTPQYIGSLSTDKESIVLSDDNDGVDITVTVRDQNGDPLRDVVITMSGCGIRTSDGKTVYGTTDGNGEVTFTGLTLNTDSKVRYIDIDAMGSDHGSKKTQIVVIP